MKTLSTCIGFVLFCCILLAASQGAQADLINKVSDIKNLGPGQLEGGESGLVMEITPSATSSDYFTVPANNNFVITTITFIPDNPNTVPPLNRGVELELVNEDASPPERTYDVWTVPFDHQTQLQFPTGLRIAPGFSLKVTFYGHDGEFMRVRINGYLVQLTGADRGR